MKGFFFTLIGETFFSLSLSLATVLATLYFLQELKLDYYTVSIPVIGFLLSFLFLYLGFKENIKGNG